MNLIIINHVTHLCNIPLIIAIATLMPSLHPIRHYLCRHMSCSPASHHARGQLTALFSWTHAIRGSAATHCHIRLRTTLHRITMISHDKYHGLLHIRAFFTLKVTISVVLGYMCAGIVNFDLCGI